uniref:Uncharacterized protein n=1 Tax=Arundo donax TaxID=35708 RepID=A0A0A9GTM5_ARUDO
MSPSFTNSYLHYVVSLHVTEVALQLQSHRPQETKAEQTENRATHEGT